MNERIQELAKQAGISILWEYDGYDGHAGVANLKDIEKFAELIVRKCAEIANRQFEAATGLNDRDCLTAAEMKKHFGVEE